MRYQNLELPAAKFPAMELIQRISLKYVPLDLVQIRTYNIAAIRLTGTKTVAIL